jgi:hypothetical protein
MFLISFLPLIYLGSEVVDDHQQNQTEVEWHNGNHDTPCVAIQAEDTEKVIELHIYLTYIDQES